MDSNYLSRFHQLGSLQYPSETLNNFVTHLSQEQYATPVSAKISFPLRRFASILCAATIDEVFACGSKLIYF